MSCVPSRDWVEDHEAIAVADTMLRESRDSLARAAVSVMTGAEEFRAHGDATTAARLSTMAAVWLAESSSGAPANRRFVEGVAMLATGRPDSSLVRFAAAAHDPARIDAAGYLALARLARGDRASARATADSRAGSARSPMALWLQHLLACRHHRRAG